MAGPGDLHELCADYLAACEEAVATGAGGAVQRAFVSPGPPAWDCEQLTVHAGGPMQADTLPLQPPLGPGHRAVEVGAIHLVNLTATVVRCIKLGADRRGQTMAPSPTDMDAGAQRTLGDVWSIWNVVRAKHRDGLLFVGPDGERRELFFDPAVAFQIEGSMAGWQVPIRVALDGYAYAEPS